MADDLELALQTVVERCLGVQAHENVLVVAAPVMRSSAMRSSAPHARRAATPS